METLQDKYNNDFMLFICDEKNRTVGKFQAKFKKLLAQYDKELRKDIFNNIKDLIK